MGELFERAKLQGDEREADAVHGMRLDARTAVVNCERATVHLPALRGLRAPRYVAPLWSDAMTRRLARLAAALFLASSLHACGGDDPPRASDAGAGDGPTSDSAGSDAPPPQDAGTDGGDGGERTDGGTGCVGERCRIVEIAAGWAFACARRENGQIVCWGANANGELGDGRMRHPGGDCTPAEEPTPQDCSADPVTVREITDARALGTRGGLSSCAIRMDGSVWCWGLSTLPPSTGSDTLVKRFVPERVMGFGDPVRDIADAWTHQCAIGMDGSVRCAGNNDSGEIGNGDTMEVRMPARVLAASAELGAMRDVELGPFSDFSCALSDDDEVFCWGNNDAFQLGDGRNDHFSCTTGGVTPHDCSPRAVPVDLPDGLTGIAGIAVGSAHACLWTTGGAVHCWGNNASGQSGGEAPLHSRPQPVAGLVDVVEVAAGGGFSCARTRGGTVWCWGGNLYGQLGDGRTDHGTTCNPGMRVIDCSRTPVQVADLDGVVDLAAGPAFACALRNDGSVWCWGDNDRKQLGDGTREPRARPVRVRGL
ncbi:MAG: hypothetical protein RMK74_14695 [Myxococcales bacterium]|nr:hypothetical protein [Myxococcales bacterium]